MHEPYTSTISQENERRMNSKTCAERQNGSKDGRSHLGEYWCSLMLIGEGVFACISRFLLKKSAHAQFRRIWWCSQGKEERNFVS